jgi:hypothetical protein
VKLKRQDAHIGHKIIDHLIVNNDCNYDYDIYIENEEVKRNSPDEKGENEDFDCPKCGQIIAFDENYVVEFLKKGK